ncbi:SMP-30/gluconolactonase/LRE family protein [Granulosicoccus antarcticus]|uniref:L-arabinolactonase n=1 Tax=Granulosicoccus antarcticus IMCC3135 TaxID=1192854 RepID=A0A2Z2NTG8_9GAMM|nr:SMP-30/gluconolactonase/LRE family protein [Granulosicoccus antarcticus]ASJ70907.1 L-arabinolactonase [Granulosicoccus antarcticus IMCC3135]
MTNKVKSSCDACVSLAFHGTDELGEGPHWSAPEKTLYWVDIVNPALQSIKMGADGTLDEKTFIRRQMPEMVGLAVPRVEGGFIAGSESGILAIDPSGKITTLAQPEAHLPDNRFNDGKCDARGRLWASSLSMSDTSEQASLWRIDPDGSLSCMMDKVNIGNGLGWSDDNRTFYFTDSGKATIYRFDFDLESGTLSNRSVFAGPDKYRKGVPDGLAVDIEGYVWSAQWDGACIIRYAPDGSIDRIINVPVPRPTSCSFGGVDGSTLFVTSARVGLSETQLAEAPLSGSLFAIESGTTGKPGQSFGATV